MNRDQLTKRPIRRSHQRTLRAYTLIEAVVTIVIMAILMTMTLSQFTGSKDGGIDVEARATALNAIRTAASLYGTTLELPASAAAASQFNPDTNFVAGSIPSTNPSMASVATNTATKTFAVAVLGGGGICEMESWTTNVTSSASSPTLYATESVTTSGFSCDGNHALMISACPVAGLNDGQSWNGPLLCSL